MPPGFHRLMATQFTSALADNALLIVCIGLLQQKSHPAWWVPLLKALYICTYVLLAPVLGPLADAVPKARLMACMNLVKLAGVAALCAGLHPLLAYAVVGLGAAAYAPAKYGLVTELVPPARLVAANAWIETSVVGAVLAGTVVGGFLVGPTFAQLSARTGLAASAVALGIAPGTTLAPALLAVASAYALASLLNLAVRNSGVHYARGTSHPAALWRQFLHANRTIWRDRDGGLSMSVTTVFWGAGAVLQFAVLRWAVDVLRLSLDVAAYLQAVVAVGVVGGAVAAGRCVAMSASRRVLPAGVVLGALVAAGAWVETPLAAWPLMTAVGFVGGLLVVPMNALLQHRGHVLLTAGRSIAVQGFNENLGVLVMLGLYALLVWAGVGIVPLLIGYGVAIAGTMLLLILSHRPARALRPPQPAIGRKAR